jgi:nicotinamide/nicotinate riboside kinase
MVIGIGGPSRSGKSTLANLLVTFFRKNGKKAIIFHQDDFVFPETQIPKIKDKTDWESPESIDHDLLLEVVTDFKERFDVVIVEGFFAFNDKNLNSIYDRRIFIKIAKRTFIIRKAMDSRWGYIPTWYIDHIWRSFLKLNKPSQIKTEYLQISGEDEFDMKKILGYLLPSSKSSKKEE